MRWRNAKEAEMATLTHRIEVHLAADELLPLAEIRGTRLRCIEGNLWLTLDRDRRDIFLAPGESFVVDGDGVALLQALAPTRLAVETCRDAAALGGSGWLRSAVAALRRLHLAASPVSACA
jgi:hypothetical protein